ncbi:MAG: 23S rRNA (guanosine(2251)-2'-O)-methyltransferase RlmB [Flavobacteriales bacterium]|nr:23S rRNA (guanosine(2251)-2'-O)-methyltransferase RlmB [Flavobacteriales bacterium]|tara:strand:- start:6693 stop:7436 length:744 start_codon:yes stop_codon:yes gene_type:complete
MEFEQKSDLVFGIHPILEGLESGKNFDKILILNTLRTPLAKEIMTHARERGISLNKVPQQKLDRITRKNHQGVIGFIAPVEFQNIEEIIPNLFSEGKTPFLLLLDRISDVRNFGAIVRTAECAGVDAIIIPKKGAAQINGETIKTSTGAIFNIPICKVPGIDSVIPYLKESGIHLIACTEKTPTPYTDIDYTVPVGIIMGSEESGIARSNITKCDSSAKLPLQGKTDSLNVSVAAGIILYEVVRQRN